MWKTHSTPYSPSIIDVDNSVENFRSYPQEKIEFVDNSVIHSLSTRFPQGVCG